MYAVIDDNGRQYCVQEGQKIEIDYRAFEPGQTLEFDRVLLVGGSEAGTKVGQPVVPGAKVVAAVVGKVKGKKTRMVMYKRRKNFRRHRGHRQPMTAISIRQIVAG